MVMLWNSAAPTVAAVGPTLAIAASGTIPTTSPVVRVSPAGAVAGIVLQPGTYNGQQVTVINEAVAANTVTPAAAGTSFVADGAASAQAGLTARTYVWDSSTNLWYRSAGA